MIDQTLANLILSDQANGMNDEDKKDDLIEQNPDMEGLNKDA